MTYNPSGEEMQKDPISANLSGRDSERIIGQFKKASQYKINFLKFSTDRGVARNGGRIGARYAPEVVLNCFKKLACQNPSDCFTESEMGNDILEIENFEESQNKACEHLINNLSSIKSDYNVYIGGGHDHIYGILKSLELLNPDKRIIVVNLDPHLDTRQDQFFNSGTPFRQFANEAKKEFSLFQIGTHPFANVQTSMLPLKNCLQKIITYSELATLTKNFTQSEVFLSTHFKSDPNAIYILSLDTDAIHASTMEAVSAPNHQGLPTSFIDLSFMYFKQNCNCQNFSIFEYNPIYENLSLKGARYLSQLIYKIIKY